MTILHGRFRDIAGKWSQGQVTIISPITRPALQASQQVITEEKHLLPLVDGRFTTPELDPGPIVLELKAAGAFHRWENILLPEEGRHDFASLLDLTTEYSPPVVGQAQAAAQAAGEHANRAETASSTAVERAGHVDSVVSNAVQIVSSEFSELSQAADTAREEAETAESNAKGHADNAALDREQTGLDRTAVVQASTAASDSASIAGGHASAASGAETRASGHADAAGVSATAASSSASDAAESNRLAGEHASNADQSRQGAAQAVSDAASQIVTDTEQAREDAQGAAEEALTYRNQSRTAKDAAEDAARQASDIATGDLPAASTAARGLIRMAGDLGGSGDLPTVPGLLLAAPGASIQVKPSGTGFSNAVAAPASRPTDWAFDGEWLSPPHWLGTVTVTLDWCGRSPALLRGRTPGGSAVTLATVPTGDPEVHRSVTIQVNLHQHPQLAVGGDWIAEDIQADCTASLLVQPVPKHGHAISEVSGLQSALDGKAGSEDPRLSDSRSPTSHQHQIEEVNGLGVALGSKASEQSVTALVQKVDARPAMWLWSGEGDWQPPAHATVIDNVINLDTGEIHSIEEVPE